MPLVLNVIGIGRKSGKTNLIETLTRRLIEKRYSVSTVKHISEGSFDTSQKDTWKHLEAGAGEVIALTSKEIVSIKRVSEPLLEMAVKEISEDSDLILVEGFKKTSYPKVIAAQTLEDVKELLKTVKEVFAISGPVSSTITLKSFDGIPILEPKELTSKIEGMILEEMVKRLPGLNCRKCGYNSCDDLAQAILRRGTSIDSCKSLLIEDMILTVDGKRVMLSEFPRGFIRNVVLGMINSLKGFDKEKIREISLSIKL
ncbi:MAG: molybdopterin-guanine dinucleotide biosynthesis adapter protein [Thermoproteota archaeon]|nr:molybdopterin-guanine dinucleotide biosynthesis adapter protein [Thermoproteota archaeon]